MAQVISRIGAEETAAEKSKMSGDTVTPEDVIQRWFAENARVFLNPGSNYGTGGAGHMRMNLATSRSLIRKALDNMAEALAQV